MNLSMPSSTLTEAEVTEAVEDFLRERRYSFSRQFRIRTWRPDFVAVKGDEVVIIETKGQFGDLRRALARTAVYATDGTAAYLAVPSGRLTEPLKDTAKTVGIGLIEVGRKARVAVKAPAGRPRPALLSRARRAVGRPAPVVPSARHRRAPSLGRVLRHRRILEALLANPRRRFTIRELSIEAQTPYATTWRTVEDLRTLGAATAERVGTSQYLSVNVDSPLVRDLDKIRSLELSPHRSVARDFARRLAEVPQVEKAVLFGSVAEGREEAGSDVDVAIVLSRKTAPVMERIYGIVSKLQDRTGMKVVPLPITASELASDTQLGRAIRAGKVLYERT